jgi:hypothetical protein
MDKTAWAVGNQKMRHHVEAIAHVFPQSPKQRPFIGGGATSTRYNPTSNPPRPTRRRPQGVTKWEEGQPSWHKNCLNHRPQRNFATIWGKGTAPRTDHPPTLTCRWNTSAASSMGTGGWEKRNKEKPWSLRPPICLSVFLEGKWQYLNLCLVC